VAEAVVRLRVDASGATRALNGVQNQTNKLQNSFNGLRNAIAATGIVLIGRQAVKTSANFEKLKVRLGLLTKESGSFSKSLQIAADAQKAFGLSATEALEGVTDITARLAPLKVGVDDIRTVFFGFNTAAKLAGASAIESSNAFRQLAQALGSGRLAGDEFRSVSEQVPTVLAPIAEELGVTIGQLKKLAADGELTSDVVLRALARVGNEGSGFLKELLKNDPTQVFKNFSNATEDLSRAFGDQLRPAVEEVTILLTKLIDKTTEFVNSPIGQTALIFTALAVAAKGVAVALPLVSVALIKVAAAGGVLTIALNAIPFVAVATGIGAIVTQLIKQKKEQDKVTEAIKKGELAQLRALEADIGIKMAKEIATINKSNDKRTIKAAERRLALLRETIKPIKERLDLAIQENAELEKANKLEEERKKKIEESKKKAEELKKKFTEIGEEIEDNIKDNLKEAIKGAQSFGDALNNVLNKIKDKLLDLALDELFKNFQRGFNKEEGDKGGVGGIIGSIIGGIFNRENGGPVKAGQPYIVGERQPELFIPNRSGTIIPSVTSGGDSITNIVNVSVDATGSTVQGDQAGSQELGQTIALVVQETLVREKRSGGLLA
tara:strand:- start:3999 stop:5825 length:1827 start_codon:yes stop_codon:yes gene_type:complete